VDLTQILLLLVGGAVAGFLAGFFGVGGGIILVPILLFYFQTIGVSSLVATHVAFGTSLLIIVFASLSSARQYAQNDHVVWRAVVTIGLASVVGSLAGSQLAGALDGKTLRAFFGILVVVSAIRLLMETRKPKQEMMPPLNYLMLILTGLFVGVVSALAGVGGGVLSIPIMHSLLKFPLKKALGTSSAAIVITAIAAAAGYVLSGWGNPLLPSGTLGYVAYLHAIPLIIGSIPMAMVGAKVAHKTQVLLLKRIFAVFLLIIAARMLLF
jgi:hypothetical protein